MIALVVLLVWLILSVISYGLTFHYFQERWRCFAYPCRWRDVALSLLSGMLWPVGFLARWLFTVSDNPKTPWGLRYRPVTAEESWQDYQQRWPGLPKEDWRDTR